MNMFRRIALPASDATAQGPGLANLVFALNDRNALQLAFRIARIARNGGRLVQFIGPQGGEGVSTIARDFAIALTARAPGPVLLLDLGLSRDGRASNEQLQFFRRRGAPFDPPRTIELAGTPKSSLRLHPLTGTSLVIAEQAADGTAALHPELLARTGLMERLRDEFDAVVVDSPPLATSFNGIAISAEMDASIVVLRAERTRALVARDLCERLVESGALMAGFVFNRRRWLIPSFLYRRLG